MDGNMSEFVVLKKEKSMGSPKGNQLTFKTRSQYLSLSNFWSLNVMIFNQSVLKKILVVAALCLAAGFSSKLAAQTQAASISSAEWVGRYSKDRLVEIANVELQAFLLGSTPGFEPFQGKFTSPRYAVNLYKLRYLSVVPEMGSRPIMATGLVAIPETAEAQLPLISYQHGTVFEKKSVPSNPDQSIETRLILSQFGGQGYIVIAADYFGLGDSELNNSYFVKDSTEQATFDFYIAAMKFVQEQGKRMTHLTTMGWSQGGYSNMILLRKFEREGIKVAASATAAGAVDLSLFITRGLTNPRPREASFQTAALCNMLFAIERYSGIPGLARDAIRAEYFPTAAAFYEHQIDFAEFFRRVPKDPRLALKPEFIKSLSLGTGPFAKIMDESASYKWLSQTPLRAYHGGQDEAVPDFIARLAVDYQRILGKTNGEGFSAGDDADHRATYVYALIHAKPWFDQWVR